MLLRNKSIDIIADIIVFINQKQIKWDNKKIRIHRIYCALLKNDMWHIMLLVVCPRKFVLPVNWCNGNDIRWRISQCRMMNCGDTSWSMTIHGSVVYFTWSYQHLKNLFFFNHRYYNLYIKSQRKKKSSLVNNLVILRLLSVLKKHYYY